MYITEVKVELKSSEIRGGIAVASDNQFHLVDQGNHRILTFRESDCTYITSIFNPDSRKRSGEYFVNIAVNSAGDLYVVDSRSGNVQVYNSSGKFMFVFGTRQMNKSEYKRGGLYSPHVIAINLEDFLFVGDENGVVSIFNRNGSFVRSFGGSGDKPGQFGNIQGMYFDHLRGQLYICEWNNDRVQVFQNQ